MLFFVFWDSWQSQYFVFFTPKCCVLEWTALWSELFFSLLLMKLLISYLEASKKRRTQCRESALCSTSLLGYRRKSKNLCCCPENLAATFCRIPTKRQQAAPDSRVIPIVFCLSLSVLSFRFCDTATYIQGSSVWLYLFFCIAKILPALPSMSF